MKLLKNLIIFSAFINSLPLSASEILQGPEPLVEKVPHPLVGPTPNQKDDARISGWYFCAREEINKQWDLNRLPLPPDYRCECTFFLDSEGKISELKLVKSSGPKPVDESLLSALQKTFPIKQNTSPLARNKRFLMRFDETEHPKLRLQLID